jgi:hypothetical protein
MPAKSTPTQIEVGGVQIRLQNVRLRADVTLDEVSLESGDIQITESEEAGGAVAARAAETKFHIMISEPHINEFLAVNLPADGALRNVRLALLSGKVRLTGQVIKSILHLPVTLEAIPLIENGVRVKLDCQAAKIGIALPAAVVELVEVYINDNPKLPLNLSRLPVPVRLDEIRCEPGRLHVTGRARLQWPPAFVSPAVAPFSAHETPAYLLPDSVPAETLPAGDTAPVSPALPA